MEKNYRAYEIRTALITVADMEGFLGQLRTIMQTMNATIVCFNADSMAGRLHAEAAITHAIRSFAYGTPVAKTLEMEALLYAAGTRQCTEASVMGLHNGENRAYVCCIPPRPGIWDALSPFLSFVDDDDEVLTREHAARLKRLFSISDDELLAAGGIDRLRDLVIERVALLDANR